MSKLIPSVGYLRRSTKDQEGSIEDQQRAIERYAEQHGYEILYWYTDDGISGDSTTERVAFLQMRNDAASGEFQAVLCWDQDRFGRFDSLDAGHWIYPFRQSHVSLVTLNEGRIDWEDFTQRLMYGIKQEGKHQYLRDLSRNVTRGQMESAKNGSWCGAVPYGYVIIGERKKKRLVLGDPSDVEIVRRIFNEYVNQDRTLAEIARRLNVDGILSPKGKIWRFDTIKTILGNVAYTGRFVFNRESRSKYHHYSEGEIVNGGRKGLNPESDWIVHEDHHPAIIDKITFEKAQKRLAKGKTGISPYTTEKNPYILTGKLFCGKCGAPLWGVKTGRKNRYYECSKRKYEGNEACPGTNISEDAAIYHLVSDLQGNIIGGEPEDILFEKAEAGALTPKDLPEGFQTLKKMFVESHLPKQDTKKIEKQIQRLDGSLNKLRRNLGYASNKKSFQLIENEIVLLESQREDLQKELGDRPTEKDINEIVLDLLGKLYQLSSGEPVKLKPILREIDQIVIHTSIKGEGSGRRHRFQFGEIYLFGKLLNAQWQSRRGKAQSQALRGGRTFVSALSGRRPKPLNDRAGF